MSKALVVGLGSMGKRRVRCLKKLGIEEIFAYDVREDRVNEAVQKYQVKPHGSIDKAFSTDLDFCMVCTSPESHVSILKKCLKNDVPAFIEASVTDSKGLEQVFRESRSRGLFFGPSCTMRYFPFVKELKRLISAGFLGDVLFFNYHTGQYLPDWHPWEDIKDFYVSNRETGGAREIVPFEMTWLTGLFEGGYKTLNAFKAKLSDMDVDIDDFYHFSGRFGNVIGNVTIEVLSRPISSRTIRVVGTKGLLSYDDRENAIQLYTLDGTSRFDFSLGTVESGYINPEEPYIEEVQDFISHLKNEKKFPNTLEKDIEVLNNLKEIEAYANNN